MKIFQFGVLRFLAVLLLSFAIPLTVFAINTQEVLKLKNTAALNGSVSVIVELSMGDAIRNLPVEYLSESGRLRANRFAQSELTSSMGLDSTNILHEYQFTPTLHLNVSPKILDKLSKSLLVKQIYEDKWLKASLAQSVDLTFPSHFSSPYTGNNEWAVAVLDTGVDKNHSFLKTGTTKKVISEACYSGAGINDFRVDSFCPGNAFSSTAVNSGLNCTGYSGCDHGTHVAGIAAGDGVSFDGMARLGKIIAIQVFTGINDVSTCNGAFNCILAFTSDVIKGLERVYALRNTYKIAAVNLSLGGEQEFGTCPSDPMAAIINLLKSAGIATIVASGNESLNSSISSPACVPNAIAVGASFDSGSQVDQRASYSNNSSVLDLYAPGSFINSSVPGGGFSVFQGTSMAAPHVAGAFAVLKHAKPEASIAEIESVLKTVGPIVTSFGVSRRRLDVLSALNILAPVINTTPFITPMLLELLLTE